MNIKNHLQPLLVALALLTRIPIPKNLWNQEYSIKNEAKSVLWYPFIGGLLASILITVATILPSHFSYFLSAILILIVWIVITGALHLDGFADCIDALFFSHKNNTNPIKVLKDPHTGSMAVVAISLLLLLKTGLIYQLLENKLSSNDFIFGIFLTCVIPRLFVIYYMQLTQYVNPNGLAKNLSKTIYTKSIIVLSVIILSLFTLFFDGSSNFYLLLSSLLVSAIWLNYWRKLWLKKIDGYTGDCLGGFIEVSEVLILTATVLLIK